MNSPIQPDSDATLRLLEDVQNGDSSARDHLLSRCLPSIRDSVGRRLRPGLRPRLDLSDVVQETQLDVVRRLDDFLRRRPMPFRLWVVKTAHERLLKIERHHLHTAKRAAEREVPWPDHSSVQLVRHLVSPASAPDLSVARREAAAEVRRILAQLPERDREVITLRIFEHLSNVEAAQVLELAPDTCKKRYARALLRLEQLLTEARITGTDQ